MKDPTKLGGWVHDPAEVRRALAAMPRPYFSKAAPQLDGTGAGQSSLVYQAFKDVNGGEYIDYPAQTIGDCVGHGFGHGIDLLAAIQIATGRRSERFEPTVTEAVYAMARVDIGGERGSMQDGAVGAWAAQAVCKLGTLPRSLLGPYDGRRSKSWGAEGVPAELKPKARDHRVRTTSLITTYHELEDALANGYPVTVCSDQGFTLERDDMGFCRPQGTWAHCMLIVGTRADERPGACIFQSWGSDVPSGPRALDQPPNSFWVDRDVVERMLSLQDSWALSNFEGYPRQELPDHWTYAGFA